jgi:hypothetical protein
MNTVTDAMNSIKEERFEPTPSWYQCRFCPFNKQCPSSAFRG